MPTFVSPGGEGLPDVVISRKAGPRRSDFFSRRALVTGTAQAFRPTGTIIDVAVVIQGLNAWDQHLRALAAFIPPAVLGGMDIAADLVIQAGRRFVPKDTHATELSIHKTFITEGDDWIYDIGPTTFYSPFLEFGTAKMRAQPFMIPAIDLVAPGWIAYNLELLQIMDNYRTPTGIYGSDPRTRNPLSALRSRLYSAAKFLGDVAVIGGRDVTGPLRSGMYSLARGLGDVSAGMSGAVGSRISRRLTGRIVGRGLGGGRVSLFGGGDYSASPGGAAGPRIYSRIAGAQSRFIVTRAGVRG